MNSRTVIEEPTAPPSDSSLKISASRAFSAPFLVLAPTVWKVRAVSPVFVKTVVSWMARKTFRPGTASFRVRQGMPLNAFS